MAQQSDWPCQLGDLVEVKWQTCYPGLPWLVGVVGVVEEFYDFGRSVWPGPDVLLHFSWRSKRHPNAPKRPPGAKAGISFAPGTAGLHVVRTAEGEWRGKAV